MWKQEEVIMKPGTQGAGRVGVLMGVLSQPQDTELLRDGGAKTQQAGLARLKARSWEKSS